MSTEVGLIESRTNRASTGMQTPTGRPDAPFASFEAARAWFPPCQSTGASPRATGGCSLPRADTRHSHANVCRALQARHRQCSRAAAFLGPHQRISFSRCLIVSAATHHVARIHPQHQHSAVQRSPSLELGPIDPRFHRPRGASLRVLPRRVAPRAHCAPTHLAEREGAQREHEREQPAPSTPGVERVPVQARHRRSGMLQ